MEEKSGVLYVVATPLGNLEDLTRRAERVLAEADLVACEDTRRTRALLSYLEIKKPLQSYYEPREKERTPEFISLLKQGKSVALVTDGGTPAISDPGYRLVRAAWREGIKVEPVPGPSALVAALSAAGLPTDRVSFTGFVARRKEARRRQLSELAARPDTLVFYESPKRLQRFLQDALHVLGDREAVIFREISKAFEERLGGSLSELLEELEGREIKGEVTVLIRGREEAEAVTEEQMRAQVSELLEKGLSVKDAASELAREPGWSRKDIYRLALEEKEG
ncbi:MAG: 16S rRNA (cytidine(1402)-2'-O)-methyltransferase [bacterium]